MQCLELSPISESPGESEQRAGWGLASPCKLLSSLEKAAPAGPHSVPPLDSPPADDAVSISSKRAFFEAMIRSTSSVKVTSKGSKLSCPLLPAEQDEDETEEIQLTIRVPRPRPASASTADQAAAQAEIASLREQLAAKEVQRLQSSQALRRTTMENANLKCIVKELTDSKAKLASNKAIQSERLEDLQREYHRVVRLADLSRSNSKESQAKSQQAQQSLASVKEDLGRHKQVVAFLKQEYTRVQSSNAELQQRVAMLERLPVLSYSTPSACMVEFTSTCCMETY